MARVHTDPSRITMEDILQETGWGLYYKVLIGVVSACNFCQAVSLVALSFALPLGTCDPFINEATILTVDMCFFFGKAIGGFLLNASSDVTGRLWLLPNSLMMIFCSTFLAAFSHTGSTLSVAMFILGSGLEANTHATRIHLAEILPKYTRGRHLITPNFFWTLGYMIATASAWKLSHHAIVDHRGSDMRLTAWRLMFAVAGGCNLIVACVTALVQPSPRYRLFRKQYDLAQSTLKLFYAINKSKYSETWPNCACAFDAQ
ncbi:synaptic vesicle glycoprotein 2B-like isoform X2 [Coccinella septempunctata]|uniref:synaptic vesicle glycoprotein 2B-like isoform X2 n=1 Tax=Coccinella septempunctata TaxID=41139 RepID=UPI001D07A6E0|nr:synaptic vesicle glycoprotein 2B-like isoform X2 [Coccinella septempunctata]